MVIKFALFFSGIGVKSEVSNVEGGGSDTGAGETLPGSKVDINFSESLNTPFTPSNSDSSSSSF